MKQELASVIRKMGLIYLSDHIRYRWAKWKRKDANKAFIADHPHEPFPHPYMIYETFRLDYARWFASGKETAAWIAEETKNLLPAHPSVLDWGCGPGRVTRHLPDFFPQAAIYGSDYNKEYIKWCTDNLKDISFSINGLKPPLTFEAGSFNLVYALSIFTHLSEEGHQLWIKEIHRVLRKGGLFFFTTHGQITHSNLLAQEQAQFNEGRLVVRAQVKEGHRMYVAYHPPSYILTLISGLFEVYKHTPGLAKEWGLQQDTWIVKKQ